jgi:CheY-like chemotaxis protein
VGLRGIVNQHEGYIWVYSEEWQGTAVSIYLPRVIDAVDTPLHSSTTNELPGGREVVLVVEDETEARALVVRLLHAQGYTVLEAADGAAALQMVDGYGLASIDLVLTDVVMPQINGLELAERLTARAPSIKVLYMPGYTEHMSVREGRLTPGLQLVYKPFTRAALIQKVRAVLDQREP